MPAIDEEEPRPPPYEDLLTSCLKFANLSILSVGSGDGSQQLAILKQGHTNLCATFYDSKELLLRKYPHAASAIKELEENCKFPPTFNVDATQLHKQLYKDTLGTFDLIIFTFPHTGVPNADPTSAASNQQLLRGFLSSAHHLLKPNGKAQLTLKAGECYEKWNLQSIVSEVTGLKYEGRSSLKKTMFPGYKHRLTNGMKGPLKQVVDKHGAFVHQFRLSSSSAPHTQSTLTWIDIVMGPVKEERTDDANEEWILSHLTSSASKKKLLTVLEIRREAFQEPLPPVPELNRSLYRLQKSGKLMQHSCQGPSKKPRWGLPPSKP